MIYTISTNPYCKPAWGTDICYIKGSSRDMHPKLLFLLVLGGILPWILQAAVAVPRVRKKTPKKNVKGILGPDDALIGAVVFIGAGALSAMLTKHIADHTREEHISEHLQAPTSPLSAITEVIHGVRFKQPSITLVAVTTFVLVTGTETLGILGQDWGTFLVPIQTPPGAPLLSYVVWWSQKRGGTLTIHNPKPTDVAVAGGVAESVGSDIHVRL
ncbi:hypothetical protein EYR36_002403 [Pleurotus pulmonarius]|nr:hypothetical protein EYR36_002403 [Pleurotus pulmonarius]